MSRFAKTLFLSGLFLGSFAASGFVLRALPVREGSFPREQRMPPLDIPPGREYFVVAPGYGGLELSHSVLYHALGDSISNARKADILFLGNSQMPLAIREEFIAPKAEASGLRVFSFGVGHAEAGRFPLALIRKHDLRPKIVVANATAGFFYGGHGLTTPARQAVKSTRWEARKRWVEGTGAWGIKWRLHSVLPKLDFLGQRLHPKMIMYRSSRTGWWVPAFEPSRRYAIKINPPPRTFEHVLPFAREYKQELDARDTLLVLTHIPGAKTYLAHLPLLTEELGVPLVAPRLEGLQTTDVQHFDRESARRFTEAFWEGFLASPEVRSRLAR